MAVVTSRKRKDLGIDVSVHYPDYTFCPNLPEWHTLVILHYLDLADGTPVTESQIPFGQMKSGMVRGGGIDHKCELAIDDKFSRASILSCLACGSYFLRRSSRQRYCQSWECQAERNRRNRRASYARHKNDLETE